jgi:hypothetical protein
MIWLRSTLDAAAARWVAMETEYARTFIRRFAKSYRALGSYNERVNSAHPMPAANDLYRVRRIRWRRNDCNLVNTIYPHWHNRNFLIVTWIGLHMLFFVCMNQTLLQKGISLEPRMRRQKSACTHPANRLSWESLARNCDFVESDTNPFRGFQPPIIIPRWGN